MPNAANMPLEEAFDRMLAGEEVERGTDRLSGLHILTIPPSVVITDTTEAIAKMQQIVGDFSLYKQSIKDS